MVDYTTKELEYIRKSRKLDEDKPSYYNSFTDQTEVVSDDFEAYLILQKVATKQKLLQVLRKSIKDNNDYSDRDSLLKEYNKNILADSNAIVAELDIETENFQEFKNSVLSEDRRFDTLKELNRMLEVINVSIQSLSFHRDQAFHDGNVIIISEERLAKDKSDSNTKKELEIWQKVISAYEGSQ